MQFESTCAQPLHPRAIPNLRRAMPRLPPPAICLQSRAGKQLSTSLALTPASAPGWSSHPPTCLRVWEQSRTFLLRSHLGRSLPRALNRPSGCGGTASPTGLCKGGKRGIGPSPRPTCTSKPPLQQHDASQPSFPVVGCMSGRPSTATTAQKGRRWVD